MDGRKITSARPRTRRLVTLAVAGASLLGTGIGLAQAREGDMPFKLIKQTNARHGHDCFWQGPRGLPYGELPDASPIQRANLYPDGRGSYWVANFSGIPQGTRVTLKGRFPRSRYMSLAIVNLNPDGSVISTDENIPDFRIAPDSGSTNPFLVGANRRAARRSYQVDVVAEEPPVDPGLRAPNTLYIGADGTGAIIYRVVLPDVKRDGAGGMRLPRPKAVRPDGQRLQGRALCEDLVTTIETPTPPGINLAAWLNLRALPFANPPLGDPATVPARVPALWEKFWNGTYSIAGLFFPPAIRATLPTTGTDFAANKDTTFITSFVNRQFGPVFVVRGKMPIVPRTYDNAPIMEYGQERYWSICQNDAPPSGRAYDCMSDFQVPRDADDNYTIVVSRPEDRPANATDACGIAWLDWGTAGEGIPAPDNRSDFGLLIIRFELEDPGFANGGQHATTPGSEAAVMGPYFPQGEYTDKAGFEALGCPAS